MRAKALSRFVGDEEEEDTCQSVDDEEGVEERVTDEEVADEAQQQQVQQQDVAHGRRLALPFSRSLKKSRISLQL